MNSKMRARLRAEWAKNHFVIECQSTAVNLAHLMNVVQEIADDLYDGHVTLIKAPNGWKVMLGAPRYDKSSKAAVRMLVAYSTPMKALGAIITDIANDSTPCMPVLRTHIRAELK